MKNEFFFILRQIWFFRFLPTFWGKSDHDHHQIKPLSKEWKNNNNNNENGEKKWANV